MASFKALSVFLIAGALPASADEAGKAAAKAYSHGAAKTASASARPADSAPGPGRMQVEEPASAASAPDAKASKAWQKSHAKGLTEAQKAAFRERKEKMEGLIALIKAKRKALRDAKPEERAALARELHSLILEKDPDPSDLAAAARVEDKVAPAPVPQALKTTHDPKDLEAPQAQRQEEIRARQMQRLKRWKGKEEND
jgi:hypothetical protein